MKKKKTVPLIVIVLVIVLVFVFVRAVLMMNHDGCGISAKLRYSHRRLSRPWCQAADGLWSASSARHRPRHDPTLASACH